MPALCAGDLRDGALSDAAQNDGSGVGPQPHRPPGTLPVAALAAGPLVTLPSKLVEPVQ